MADSPKRAEVKFECIIPILSVLDLDASLNYYVKKLGFKVDWRSGGSASVSRGTQPGEKYAIMMTVGGQGQPGTWVWIGVEDVMPLYAEYVASGATILQGPTNYSWALEFRVEDPDGHVLRFGSDSIKGAPVVE